MLQQLLELVNIILTSGIVIFSCALLLYLGAYNLHSSVTRNFIALLGCVLVTYFVDLAVVGATDVEAAVPWLRFQWLGIAFTPAAYLSFSDALLVTTGAYSRLRSGAVRASYFLSTLLLMGVAFTDLIAQGGQVFHHAVHLTPGPLFPLFIVYFFAAVGWGAYNALWARRRCLTSTSRRRMTYLLAAFAAPAAGVFPYLLLAGWPAQRYGVVFWLLLVVSNVGVGLMLVILSYSVAFFGALTPDRVVKHRLARFLLRGPLLATLVVVTILAARGLEGWLGLSSNRLMLFGVVVVILLLQLGIEPTKPLLDRLLYRQDQPEISWLQELSNRLLTTTDLRQFLENVLTALCDLLRVETAFIAVVDDGAPHLEIVCGTLAPGTADCLPPETWRASAAEHVAEQPEAIFTWNGYWLIPLHAGDRQAVIGVVGIAARAPVPDLNSEEQAGVRALLAQATAALEDRQLQKGIFGALQRMIPQIEDIQRRGGMIHYVGEDALSRLRLVEDAEFRRWVWDALAHYWGGPKLTASPLRSLQVVERAAREHNGNVLQGLRSVLKQAIERLRPAGQRQMTAPEWVLYNILELKFLQGRHVREIAHRLAMSESDLYRKQRVAIEAVAKALAEMEREELNGQD